MTKPEKTDAVLNALDDKNGITTYGVHKDYYIVAVLEAETSQELEELTEHIQQTITGVLGVFPAYVNFENEVNET